MRSSYKLLKTIDRNPNYQFQLLEIVLQVKEEVMEKAELKGLNAAKK